MKDVFPERDAAIPRLLVAISLGVFNSVSSRWPMRRSNPVTAVALVGALVSGKHAPASPWCCGAMGDKPPHTLA